MIDLTDVRRDRSGAPMHCLVCNDFLYVDEPGNYCQDCRWYMHRRYKPRGSTGPNRPTCEEHEARIIAHMERVEREEKQRRNVSA